MAEATGANSTTIPYLINYTSLGGRVFTTHNSDAWLDTTNTGTNGYYFYSAGGSSPMTWGSAANSVTPDPGYALINTSFSDGNTLASWLYENGYSYGASGNNTGTENEVEISTLALQRGYSQRAGTSLAHLSPRRPARPITWPTTAAARSCSSALTLHGAQAQPTSSGACSTTSIT